MTAAAIRRRLSVGRWWELWEQARDAKKSALAMMLQREAIQATLQYVRDRHREGCSPGVCPWCGGGGRSPRPPAAPWTPRQRPRR